MRTLPVLRRKLGLESRQRVADGAGGFVETWVPLGTLWADVAAGSGRELRSEEVRVSATTYRITVRSAPVGSPRRPMTDQRFRDGGRVFHILSVADADVSGRFLVCVTREEGVSA